MYINCLAILHANCNIKNKLWLAGCKNLNHKIIIAILNVCQTLRSTYSLQKHIFKTVSEKNICAQFNVMFIYLYIFIKLLCLYIYIFNAFILFFFIFLYYKFLAAEITHRLLYTHKKVED